MTTVKDQIHRLVPKNDAVIIVIEDDCDATTFQYRCAQERFAHTHHVKCDLDQNSSATVRRHVPVHHFLSVVLQCHVVRCHCLDVCRTHHWKLRCENVRNIKHRSSTRVPHRVSTFLAVFHRRIRFPRS